MAWEIEVILKPSRSLCLEILDLFFAFWLNKVAKSVFSVHELIDLALIIVLQVCQSISNDLEEDVVEDLELVNQSLLEGLEDDRRVDAGLSVGAQGFVDRVLSRSLLA